MNHRFGVAGIQPQRLFVRFNRTGHVARPLESVAQKKARPALGRKQLDGSPERRHRRCWIFFCEHDPQIEKCLRHFWVKCGRAFVLGARFISLLESGVRIRKLEMSPGYIRFFTNESLQGNNCGFELVAVYIALRLIEKIVKRIGKLLCSCLRRLLLRGLRTWAPSLSSRGAKILGKTEQKCDD